MAAFISKVQHKLISLITLRVSKATATRTKPNIAHPSQEGSADNNADEGAGENQPNGRENRSESVSRPSSHTLGNAIENDAAKRVIGRAVAEDSSVAGTVVEQRSCGHAAPGYSTDTQERAVPEQGDGYHDQRKQTCIRTTCSPTGADNVQQPITSISRMSAETVSTSQSLSKQNGLICLIVVECLAKLFLLCTGVQRRMKQKTSTVRSLIRCSPASGLGNVTGSSANVLIRGHLCQQLATSHDQGYFGVLIIGQSENAHRDFSIRKVCTVTSWYCFRTPSLLPALDGTGWNYAIHPYDVFTSCHLGLALKDERRLQVKSGASQIQQEYMIAIEEGTVAKDTAHGGECEQTCSPSTCTSTDTMQQPITASPKKIVEKRSALVKSPSVGLAALVFLVVLFVMIIRQGYPYLLSPVMLQQKAMAWRGPGFTTGGLGNVTQGAANVLSGGSTSCFRPSQAGERFFEGHDIGIGGNAQVAIGKHSNSGCLRCIETPSLPTSLAGTNCDGAVRPSRNSSSFHHFRVLMNKPSWLNFPDGNPLNTTAERIKQCRSSETAYHLNYDKVDHLSVELCQGTAITENVASEVHTSQHQGPDMTVSKDSPVADSVQERRPGSTVHLEDNSALEEESSVDNDAHVEESEQTCSPRICISTDTMQQPITASSKKGVEKRSTSAKSPSIGLVVRGFLMVLFVMIIRQGYPYLLSQVMVQQKVMSWKGPGFTTGGLNDLADGTESVLFPSHPGSHFGILAAVQTLYLLHMLGGTNCDGAIHPSGNSSSIHHVMVVLMNKGPPYYLESHLLNTAVEGIKPLRSSETDFFLKYDVVDDFLSVESYHWTAILEPGSMENTVREQQVANMTMGEDSPVAVALQEQLLCHDNEYYGFVERRCIVKAWLLAEGDAERTPTSVKSSENLSQRFGLDFLLYVMEVSSTVFQSSRGQALHILSPKWDWSTILTIITLVLFNCVLEVSGSASQWDSVLLNAVKDYATISSYLLVRYMQFMKNVDSRVFPSPYCHQLTILPPTWTHSRTCLVSNGSHKLLPLPTAVNYATVSEQTDDSHGSPYLVDKECVHSAIGTQIVPPVFRTRQENCASDKYGNGAQSDSTQGPADPSDGTSSVSSGRGSENSHRDGQQESSRLPIHPDDISRNAESEITVFRPLRLDSASVSVTPTRGRPIHESGPRLSGPSTPPPHQPHTPEVLWPIAPRYDRSHTTINDTWSRDGAPGLAYQPKEPSTRRYLDWASGHGSVRPLVKPALVDTCNDFLEKVSEPLPHNAHDKFLECEDQSQGRRGQDQNTRCCGIIHCVEMASIRSYPEVSIPLQCTLVSPDAEGPCSLRAEYGSMRPFDARRLVVAGSASTSHASYADPDCVNDTALEEEVRCPQDPASVQKHQRVYGPQLITSVTDVYERCHYFLVDTLAAQTCDCIDLLRRYGVVSDKTARDWHEDCPGTDRGKRQFINQRIKSLLATGNLQQVLCTLLAALNLAPVHTKPMCQVLLTKCTELHAFPEACGPCGSGTVSVQDSACILIRRIRSMLASQSLESEHEALAVLEQTMRDSLA